MKKMWVVEKEQRLKERTGLVYLVNGIPRPTGYRVKKGDVIVVIKIK